MDEEAKKQREQAKIRARKPNRATYDLPPALRARMRLLGEEHRIPASQLVTLALLRFLDDYEQGRLDLPRYQVPSRSPRYDWNLQFPRELLRVLRSRRRSGTG